jgi:hypothetical protein
MRTLPGKTISRLPKDFPLNRLSVGCGKTLVPAETLLNNWLVYMAVTRICDFAGNTDFVRSERYSYDRRNSDAADITPTLLKKPYASPVVTLYGTFTEITSGGDHPSFDNADSGADSSIP